MPSASCMVLPFAALWMMSSTSSCGSKGPWMSRAADLKAWLTGGFLWTASVWTASSSLSDPACSDPCWVKLQTESRLIGPVLMGSMSSNNEPAMFVSSFSGPSLQALIYQKFAVQLLLGTKEAASSGRLQSHVCRPRPGFHFGTKMRPSCVVGWKYLMGSNRKGHCEWKRKHPRSHMVLKI